MTSVDDITFQTSAGTGRDIRRRVLGTPVVADHASCSPSPTFTTPLLSTKKCPLGSNYLKQALPKSVAVFFVSSALTWAI